MKKSDQSNSKDVKTLGKFRARQASRIPQTSIVPATGLFLLQWLCRRKQPPHYVACALIPPCHSSVSSVVPPPSFPISNPLFMISSSNPTHNMKTSLTTAVYPDLPLLFNFSKTYYKYLKVYKYQVSFCSEQQAP